MVSVPGFSARRGPGLTLLIVLSLVCSLTTAQGLAQDGANEGFHNRKVLGFFGFSTPSPTASSPQQQGSSSDATPSRVGGNQGLMVMQSHSLMEGAIANPARDAEPAGSSAAPSSGPAPAPAPGPAAAAGPASNSASTSASGPSAAPAPAPGPGQGAPSPGAAPNKQQLQVYANTAVMPNSERLHHSGVRLFPEARPFQRQPWGAKNAAAKQQGGGQAMGALAGAGQGGRLPQQQSQQFRAQALSRQAVATQQQQAAPARGATATSQLAAQRQAAATAAAAAAAQAGQPMAAVAAAPQGQRAAGAKGVGKKAVAQVAPQVAANAAVAAQRGQVPVPAQQQAPTAKRTRKQAAQAQSGAIAAAQAQQQQSTAFPGLSSETAGALVAAARAASAQQAQAAVNAQRRGGASYSTVQARQQANTGMQRQQVATGGAFGPLGGNWLSHILSGRRRRRSAE